MKGVLMNEMKEETQELKEVFRYERRDVDIK